MSKYSRKCEDSYRRILSSKSLFSQLQLGIMRTTRQEYVVPQPRSPTQSPVADEAASIGVDVRFGGATNTGRKITEIDQDPSILLVQHDAKIHGRYGHDIEFDYDFDTAEKDVSTAEPVYTSGAAVTTDSVTNSTVSATRNTRVSTADDITMAETLMYIRKSTTKEKAVRLHVKLDKEERQRIARVLESSNSINVEEWEDIQARVKVDEELVQRLQAEEKEKAKARRNKPPTQAQQRTYMCNYIKNMEGYTLQQLRVPELAVGSSKRDAKEELDQGGSKRQKTGESLELAKEPRDKV
nr:hypothetical protein [Tanacetum cinerariifolium]